MEILHWLLARGANANATAAIDADGFGGHTPLFHTVRCSGLPSEVSKITGK